MKKAASAILLFVLLSLVLSLFAGCANNNEESLYFLNFKPEVADVYNRLAADYKKETGKTLRVVTAASGTYEQTLKSEIGKKDPPVLFQINGPKGYASWKNYCLDLSDSAVYQHLTDKSLAIRDGKGVYGIPYVVEGYGIIYNKKLTDKYFALTERQTNVNSMEEIKSFASLKTVVEDMTRLKETLGIQGVFASTSLKSGEDWRFQTHLANVPIYYEFTGNNVDLSTDATKKVNFTYNKEYKQLFDLYINNSCTDKKLLGSKQVSDSMAEFALEQCVMVQNGNWAWGQIKSVAGNKTVAEDIRFLPLYMGTPDEMNMGLCIGTENFFAINKTVSAEKQKLALDFLEWLYTSETGKDYVLNKLEFIAPFDTFTENERPSDPLAKEMLRYMNDETLTTIPWYFTVFPSQAFKSDFGAALLQYAQETKTWDDVVRVFVERWEAESR